MHVSIKVKRREVPQFLRLFKAMNSIDPTRRTGKAKSPEHPGPTLLEGFAMIHHTWADSCPRKIVIKQTCNQSLLDGKSRVRVST